MHQSSENSYLEAIEIASKASGPLTVIGTKALVFHVKNLKAASDELEQKGVVFLWRERYLAEDSLLCSMILDPDGNRINIFQSDTVA